MGKYLESWFDVSDHILNVGVMLPNKLIDGSELSIKRPESETPNTALFNLINSQKLIVMLSMFSVEA